jgi:hypothetical protein
MSMGRKPKIGRRADARDRLAGACFAESARAMLAAGDDPRTAATMLIQALDHFAAYGTFQDERDGRAHFAHEIVYMLGDVDYETKKRAVMHFLHCSDSTAARLLAKRITWPLRLLPVSNRGTG